MEFSYITTTLQKHIPWQESKEYICHICRISRPPRSSHSFRSKRCVRGFDHYCLFLGTDIGSGNYRYFLLALFVMSCVVMPSFLSSSSRYMRDRSDAYLSSIDSSAGTGGGGGVEGIEGIERVDVESMQFYVWKKGLMVFIVWAFITMLQVRARHILILILILRGLFL